MTVAVEGHSPDLAPGRPGQAPRQHLVAGRFRLVEQLGRGGMGRVFRAHDEVLDRPVAVKLIYDDAVRDRDVQHACALEARAAARLNHPGIVRILDSGFDDGHCYVVMSLAEGRTLAEILREDGPLPVNRALDLAIQVADALAAAHNEGVIHCDVKPGNLLVDASWRVRLVDFGIARVTSSTTGLTGELLQGSAQYVAPEQVEGASVDGRTDLYALGTVLYEMLTGQTPFGGGTIASILARRLVNDPPPLHEIDPAIPPRLEQVVLNALARDPDLRIQTAAELRDALMAVREAVPIFPPPPRNWDQHDRPSRWAEIRPAGLASLRLNVERSWRAMLAGAARAATWIVASGLTARKAAATALPEAMARAHLLTPARRPTLRAGVGLAMLLGLLVGATAAKCGVARVTAETTIASEQPAVTAGQRTGSMPVAIPVQAAPLAQSAAPIATAPPVPAPVLPTATAPAPTPTPEAAVAADAEPAAPSGAAPAAPRAPVRALAVSPPAPTAPAEADSAPLPHPADTVERGDGREKENNLSNTPRSDERTPEERAKADAKKNEEEKRAEQPKPARASTLAPYVGKPGTPKPEPTRQQAPPKPQSAVPPPTQAAPKPEAKRLEQGQPVTRTGQPRGNEQPRERDD